MNDYNMNDYLSMTDWYWTTYMGKELLGGHDAHDYRNCQHCRYLYTLYLLKDCDYYTPPTISFS